MGQQSRMLEVYIGTFVLGGIMLVMGLILTLTGGISFLDDTYKVVVSIDNVGALKKGAPVKVGGFVIGRVSNIELHKHDIAILASIDDAVNLANDCKAKISTEGVVGDAFLEITRGESKTMISKKDTEWGKAPQIEGIGQPSMGEMFLQMKTIGDELEIMVKNVNDLIGNQKVKNDIVETIANVNATTKELVKVVGRVGGTVDEVESAITKGVKVLDKVESIVAKVDNTLDDTIGDPKQLAAIKKMVKSMSEITAEMAANRETIGKTMQNVETVTGRFAVMSKSINTNEGIWAVLFDQQAGNEFRATLSNLQMMINRLSQNGPVDLLADQDVASRIVDQWWEEHKHLPADRKAVEWEKFRRRINAIGNDMIRMKVNSMNGTR